MSRSKSLSAQDPKFLVLGGGDGWHTDQLIAAAKQAGCELRVASYESMSSRIDGQGVCQSRCEAGELAEFDAILTRTMPAGSLERVTFRLAMLHALVGKTPLVNPPRGLEIAIDKFATLAVVGSLGYDVPATIVVQTRREAMDAFLALGGDCVVKPVFGGEGRGVSRIRDRELAWYTFATLDQLDAVMYVQQFVPPGGMDTRMLVIGDEVIGVRRRSEHDFRTNLREGSRCEPVLLTPAQTDMARRVTRSMGLLFAAVDVIDGDDGLPRILEVNAIPGWRGTQGVVEFSIAQRIISLLVDQSVGQQSHA